MKKKIMNSLLLICVGIMFMVFAVGSGTNVSTDATTYKLNDDITVKTNSGEYRVKFTKIYETSYRNNYSDKRADRVVVIEFEYENISIEDDLNISDFNFNLYDKDNNKLETYPFDYKSGGSVGKGRKTTASAAYALNNTNNYIELEFYDNMFNSKPNFKVIFEW